MGEEWRRGYNDFSLRMSSSLSKRWVCVVENLSRVFLSKWPPLHLWVMKVYIVWVKGKKVTHKNPLGRMFCDYLVGRPYPQDIRENDSLARLFSFQSCAPHMPFSQEPFSRISCKLVAKCTDLYLNLNFHQLNTKPNTIKSHKIQGTKLKQFHVLSWNKANIKHSCKSQLYNLPLWLFHDKIPYNIL